MSNITTKYCLYLLHFSERVQGKQHYTGITMPDRLETRMQEHARGSGSALTRNALLQKALIYLVDVQPCEGHGMEQRVKRGGHAKERCSLCTPRIRAVKMLPIYIPQIVVNRPAAVPVLGWPQRPIGDRENP